MTDSGTPEKSQPNLDQTIAQSAESLKDSRLRRTPGGTAQAGSAPRIPGYTLAALLGQGAFAQVWRATQVRTGRTVAVKVFIERRGVNWLLLQREVERLIRLDRHPNIVALLDADLGHDPAYYTMDLLEGGSLDRYVGQGEPVDPAKAARWMEEIAEALAYVHGKGVIHCDLKPANVLLDDLGRVRVADFGQSKVATEASGALGTFMYMAPEQAVTGEEAVAVQPDVRWDIFALGRLVYAIITGRVPSTKTQGTLETAPNLAARLRMYREMVMREPLPSLHEATEGRVDEDLSAVVDKAMAPDPARRYGSIGDILVDLSARRKSLPVSPLANRRSYRLKRYLRRNAVLVGVGAIACVLLAAASAQVLRDRGRTKDTLASLYLERAQRNSESGNTRAALAYAAEAYRLSPTTRYRIHAAGYLAQVPCPGRLLEIGNPVTVARFSPDGRRVLTGATDGTVAVRDAGTGDLVSRGPQHPDAVRDAAFCADGMTVATGSGDGTVALWSATASGAVRKTLYRAGAVRVLSFTPDGSLLLIGRQDGSVVIVNTLLASEVGRPFLHRAGPRAAALSPDGTRLAVGCDDGSVWIWTTGKARSVAVPPGHRDVVVAVAFTPDGKRVFTAALDGIARFWDARTGMPAGRPLKHEGRITAAGLSPDGKRAVTAGDDGTVRFWNPADGALVGAGTKHRAAVNTVAFSPDGSRVLTGGADRTAVLWKADTGEPAGSVLFHDGEVYSVEFSRGGNAILTAGQDGFARLWTVQTQSTRSIIITDAQGYEIRAVGGSKPFAVGTRGSTARIWNTRDGKPTGPPLDNAGEALLAVFNNDGSRVHVLNAGRTSSVWDTATGKLVARKIHNTQPRAIGLIAGGSVGVTAENKSINLWKVASGEQAGSLKDEADILAVSPDSRFLFAAGLNTGGNEPQQYGRVWNLDNLRPVGDRVILTGPVHSARFSQDGKYILTVCRDGTMLVWNTKAGKPFGRPLDHGGEAETASFSPDSRLVVSAGPDGRVRIRDRKTGEKYGDDIELPGEVSEVDFLSDSEIIAVTRAGAIRVVGLSWLADQRGPGELGAVAGLASALRIDRDGLIEHVRINTRTNQ